MKLRAFVVMPFGPKEVPGEGPKIEVDFDRVYNELLKPALEDAGCDVVRADSERGAGDIRTDMFFELVTADIVVADLSALNPNVYYELGIRDGVRRQGVFIIDGGWPGTRPFDVASDRAFHYQGGLFGAARQRHLHPFLHQTSPSPAPDPVRAERERLARTLNQAIAADSETTGSPLYSHLHGLKQVDWEGIDTTKARYFTALRDDWEQQVRLAAAKGCPGHILTLADDAPTRLHRTKILKQAVQSLTGLCRFTAAGQYATELAELCPDDIEAQAMLAVALMNRGDLLRAEEQMRKVLGEHSSNQRAGWLLGMVYRDLWRVQWCKEEDPKPKAMETADLLASAIRTLYQVQRRYPDAYIAGYNALLLLQVLDDLFAGHERARPETPAIDVEELRHVVAFAARAARQTSEETGDSDNQFWSSAALSGLCMLGGQDKQALRGIAEACSFPGTTRFHLQQLEFRLDLLKDVGFRSDFIGEALKTVQQAIQAKPAGKEWGSIVLFLGSCQLTPAELSVFRGRVRAVLEKWRIGADDLALGAGTSDEDLVFAEECLLLKAKPTLRLLLLEESDAELARRLGEPGSGAWDERHSVLERCEIWFHGKELGMPLDAARAQERHKRWMLNTALMEAENHQHQAQVCGLFLWDGQESPDSLNNLSALVAQVCRADGYRGKVERIDRASLGLSESAAAGAGSGPGSAAT
jgi:hypothetical protein